MCACACVLARELQVHANPVQALGKMEQGPKGPGPLSTSRRKLQQETADCGPDRWRPTVLTLGPFVHHILLPLSTNLRDEGASFKIPISSQLPAAQHGLPSVAVLATNSKPHTVFARTVQRKHHVLAPTHLHPS